MDKTGRLNGIIAALEEGRKPTMAFARAEREEAIQLGMSQLDGVLFEMEHTPYSPSELRDALQFMLNRRRMIEGASLRPSVTPFVRIPANGAEMNTWMAKQVLDQGVYGVVFPHIATAEQARNAVAACRYARMSGWDDLSHCRILFELLAEAGRNPRIHTILKDNTDGIRDLLTAALAAGQARGEVDPSLDPRHTSAVLVAVLDAAPMLPLMTDGLDFGESRKLITTMVSRFLRPQS